MTGPHGAYDLQFVACDDWDGEIFVVICGHSMVWQVVSIDFEDGQSSLSGMTVGSDSIWPTQFWFVLFPALGRSRIEYWGNQVIWRTDFGAGYTGRLPWAADA
jgi:hypothetical protein